MSADKSKLIEGRTGPWEIVLGLEVHAQVASKAKLFSGAAVGFGAGPQRAGEPGGRGDARHAAGDQPRCVEQAVRTGLGLKAKINPWSRFDRKNYFYPDLPQGYQISQYKDPIVGEGEIEVERDDGSTFTVRIERLHLEQDAGKSIHDLDPNATYVDLNRAGTALMEIVSHPDMRSLRRGGGLCEEAAHHPALPRHLRRRHGEGQPARRRQRLGAQAGRAARHPLRDQERQLLPLHPAGDRVRGAPADRDPRGRRQDRPGDPAVRPGQGRDPLDALQGGGATTTATSPIRTCCRWSWIRPGSKTIQATLPELPDDKRRRLHERSTACRPMTPAC